MTDLARVDVSVRVLISFSSFPDIGHWEVRSQRTVEETYASDVEVEMPVVPAHEDLFVLFPLPEPGSVYRGVDAWFCGERFAVLLQR